MKLTDCQKELGLEIVSRAAYRFAAQRHQGHVASFPACLAETFDEMEQEVQVMQQEAERKEEAKK